MFEGTEIVWWQWWLIIAITINTTINLIVLFKGRMTTLSVTDTPQGSNININAENRLIDLDRPSNFRYTKESQKFIDSSDSCFNRVQAMADREIIWGRSSTNTGSGSGGRGSGSGAGTPRNDKVGTEIK